MIFKTEPLLTYLPPRRPMLAAQDKLGEKELAEVFKRIPILFASRKIDGVRGICFSSPGTTKVTIYSRSLEPLPNKHLQNQYAHPFCLGLDGEMISGTLLNNDAFQSSVSAVMSINGTPDLSWCIFDYIRGCAQQPYYKRLSALSNWYGDNLDGCKLAGYIYFLPFVEISSVDALLEYERNQLSLGAEGVMLRDPMAPYKYGRSSLREGGMLKLKRFLDSEAVILDIIQLEINCNEQTVSNLGLAKRSSAAGGKMLANKMGALAVKDLKTGIEFNLGSGFTDAQRRDFWIHAGDYVGKIVKYKHQPFGVKDKPRTPIFLGIRPQEDM